MGESTYCTYPNDHEMGTFTIGEGKQFRYDVNSFNIESGSDIKGQLISV